MNISTVTINQVAAGTFGPPGEGHVCVHLAGDLDLAAEPALDDAVARIAALAPRTVVVDLAAVTFACTTLANFIVALYHALPGGTPLLLCRPPPLTRRVLELASMEMIATVRDDLPPPGC